MDRFTSVMIAFCIGACVAIACVALGTSSLVVTKIALGPSNAGNEPGPVQPIQQPTRNMGGLAHDGDGKEQDGNDQSADDLQKETADKPPTALANHFARLTNEQKNELWWKIADESTRKQGEEVTYVLDAGTAIRLAREIGCSEDQLKRFFYEGPRSNWLVLRDTD